ncbi:MAG: DUF4124 domain-containing protein [Pseudomonadota bacterium]
MLKLSKPIGFLLTMIAKILISLSLTLLLCTAALAGPVYKWTEDGRIIYSQTPPPPGIEFEVVFEEDIGKKSTSVAKVDSDSSGGTSTFEERRDARKQNEAEKKVLEESNKIKAENCAIATKNMESLTSRGQVTIKDGDIYRKLTEEERQSKINETKEQVSEFCS